MLKRSCICIMIAKYDINNRVSRTYHPIPEWECLHDVQDIALEFDHKDALVVECMKLYV